jgi:hypothetical protein
VGRVNERKGRKSDGPEIPANAVALKGDQQESRKQDIRASKDQWKDLGRWERWRFVFEVIVTVSAILGGWFFYQRLALTREQQHIDKRPWLMASENPVGGPREFAADGCGQEGGRDYAGGVGRVGRGDTFPSM